MDVRRSTGSALNMQMGSGRDFTQWLDAKLKIDSIHEISKYSDLNDDWQFVQEKVFEFIHFYDESTVNYVCKLFKHKWINSSMHRDSKQYTYLQKFIFFRHTSPMMIQILDKFATLNNKLMDSPDQDEDGGYRNKEHISSEVNKYLCFFELFIHNRLNMLLLQQLNASTYLLELLKYYINSNQSKSTTPLKML